MFDLDGLGLVVRVMAAVVWALVVWRWLRGTDIFGTPIRIGLAAFPFVGVLLANVVRSLTINGIVPDDVSAPIIMAAVFAAFLAGVGLLTTDPT